MPQLNIIKNRIKSVASTTEVVKLNNYYYVGSENVMTRRLKSLFPKATVLYIGEYGPKDLTGFRHIYAICIDGCDCGNL